MFYKEIWTDKEKIMINRVYTILEEKRMVEIHKQLHESLVALEYQAIALSLYPSALHSNRLGGKERNLVTLVELLSEKYHEEDMLVMPSKAMLGRSYEVSKINTLYMIKHIILVVYLK